MEIVGRMDDITLLNKVDVEKNIFKNIKQQEFSQELFPAYHQNGTTYYDLANLTALSNIEMAKLIREIKNSLRENTETCFLNTNPEIKEKIKALGLDHVIYCN
jgi:hypothetical protein